jgi:hypothetical protein
MEIGFDTVGNATLVLHDKVPLLATDPWITGSAYFGSWALAHEIPAEQVEAIRRCKYLWISHGHPDHLSGESLETLRDKTILLPDHRGGRVFHDLQQQGFHVQLIPDRTWVELSPRVRVLCVPDYNQDAVLLADVNGRLVVNLNDAGDRGCGWFVRSIVRRYKRSFLLSLVGRGAGMINYFDEDGRRVPPDPKTPVGQTLFNRVVWWGTTAAIPFSSMHRFQRTDSAWAIPYGDTLQEYNDGFDRDRAELLPAYVRYDCSTDDVTPLNPRTAPDVLLEPREFGDDWTERLEPADKAALRAYFARFEHLRKNVDFLRFLVGGEETIVELRRGPKGRGVTFEVPRASLMASVKYEIFDDLLIGNFMKVTLHGKWTTGRLNPDFSPWVAKYGDNGRAHTMKELREYHRSYFERAPADYLRHCFETKFLLPLQEATASALRSRLGQNSVLFRATKQAYWGIRSRLI